MKNSEVLDRIMVRLAGRTNPKVRTEALAELTIRVEELEKQPVLPWFLESDWVGATVVDQDWVALPDNFLLEIEETNMILDVSGVKYLVKKKTLDFLRETTAGQTGTPAYYALLGERVYFGPRPVAAYAFTLPYVRKSTPFLDNADAVSDWFKHAFNPMVYSTVSVVAGGMIQNADMAASYGKMAGEAWAQFNLYCEARRYTNLDISAGEE